MGETRAGHWCPWAGGQSDLEGRYKNLGVPPQGKLSASLGTWKGNQSSSCVPDATFQRKRLRPRGLPSEWRRAGKRVKQGFWEEWRVAAGRGGGSFPQCRDCGERQRREAGKKSKLCLSQEIKTFLRKDVWRNQGDPEVSSLTALPLGSSLRRSHRPGLSK